MTYEIDKITRIMQDLAIDACSKEGVTIITTGTHAMVRVDFNGTPIYTLDLVVYRGLERPENVERMHYKASCDYVHNLCANV